MRDRYDPLRKHPISFEPYEAAEGFLAFDRFTYEFGNRNRIAGLVPAGLLVIHRKIKRDGFYLFTVGLLPWSGVERLVIRRAFSPWRIGTGLALLAFCAFKIYECLSKPTVFTYFECIWGLLALFAGAFFLFGMACNRIEARGRTGEDPRVETFTWTSEMLDTQKTRAHCAVALRYAKAAGVPVTSHIDDDGAEFPESPPPSSN